MSLQRKIRIPDTAGFEMTYYYSRENTETEARRFPTHVHDIPELYILAEGACSFAVENRVYRLKPGDVIVSRPNEMHNCILTEPSRHQHLCFWFDPDFALLDRILDSCTGSGNLISPPPEKKKRILELCDALDKAGKEERHRREYALVCLLLCEIEESIGTGEESTASVPERLSVILRDINDNFSNIESLDYFTEKYFLSASTLGRLFRTHLHTTPRAYLETKKLSYSRILLREGNPVSEACRKAGFSDLSGYIRLFRQRFGVTPGEYKRGAAVKDY